MFKWIIKLFRIIFDAKLESVLNETKVIKVKGVKFKIKKLDVLEHLKGSNALIQNYDIYSIKKEDREINVKKIKEHYRQVFLSCIISPKFSLKEKEGYTLVDRLFEDWELCNDLYNKIIEFTYGKKKLKLLS